MQDGQQAGIYRKLWVESVVRTGVTDIKRCLEVLENDGYVVLPRRLTSDEVLTACEAVQQLLADVDWGTGFDGERTRRVWALLARSRCMDAAALDRLVLSLADQVIGERSQFSLTQAVQIHPGQKAQPFHYEQGIYPVPRDKDVMLTALWALDDFTAENGATLVVPGSHQLHHGRPEPADAVPVEMPTGSVLVFRGRLWHAGGANRSNAPRLGVIIDYVQPRLRPCEAHTLSVNHDEAKGLPQRLQELLGFNQPSPYMGFVNGGHPREWLISQ
jgi:ectoine hydroxylase-related dioxygenase (phytanoyl-CoA dioxygenase family)